LWCTDFLVVQRAMAAAYLATRFNNIMDFLQLVFAFVNAPLFATFLLGAARGMALHHGLSLPKGAIINAQGVLLRILFQ
jgi:solute:Na+ symporter, SSS family